MIGMIEDQLLNLEALVFRPLVLEPGKRVWGRLFGPSYGLLEPFPGVSTDGLD